MSRFSLHKTDPCLSYFALSTSIFSYHLCCGELAIYAYLCYLVQLRPDIGAPTLRGIADAVGIKSKSTVKKYLDMLDEKRLVEVCPQEVLSAFRIPQGVVLYQLQSSGRVARARHADMDFLRKHPERNDFHMRVVKPHRKEVRAAAWMNCLRRRIHVKLDAEGRCCTKIDLKKLYESLYQYERPGVKFFPVSAAVFSLGLRAGEIAVFCALMYREDRRSYTCYPSYRTIGRDLHMNRNTVAKYVGMLVEDGLIATENTLYETKDGHVRNGNLKYYILPIQNAIEIRNRRMLRRAQAENERARVQRRLAQQAEERNTPSPAGDKQPDGSG